MNTIMPILIALALMAALPMTSEGSEQAPVARQLNVSPF